MIRIRLLTVFCSIIICASSSFADDPIQTGKAALAKGDYLGAISAFRDAVHNDKKNTEAYILLGEALLKGDSTDAALAALIQARELDTASSRIYELMGDVYTAQKILPPAIDAYRKATEIDSTNCGYFVKLADAAKAARQYTESARAYGKVLGCDSTNIGALTELSNLFSKAKQYANAKVILDRLYRLKPEDPTVQMQYGRALYETKEPGPLEDISNKILARDPNNPDAQEWARWALTVTGQDTAASKFYDKANIDSLTVKQLIQGGRVYKNLKMSDKALMFFERAYQKDSANCEIYYDLASLYLFQKKRYADASAMFEKKLACDTSEFIQWAAHLNMAMADMQLKKFKEAAGHAQASIAHKPENVPGWQTLAECYAQMEGKTDSEIIAYKKMMELASAANTNGDAGKYDKQMAEGTKMLGIRYLIIATQDKEPKTNKEKYRVSFDWLKKALVYAPKDCDLLLYAGEAAQNSNLKDDAKKYYCKLQDTCPGSKQAGDAKKYLNALGLKCGE